ncbi:hypothetical protein FACS189432_07430 [Bacteroidia bacterium]|nr:hypothetical protein FACS189426_02990 [Bacteroidia bacterium]GHT28877.1 hypothetical protein FACS189432_07430 [Bacteroidia bacterium]
MKTLSIELLFFFCVNLVWAQDLENIDITVDMRTTEVSELSVYLQNAQYLKAIEYINRQEPTKDLLYQKAICYRFLNDFSKAGEILESLSETYPDDIPIRLQLALCYESTLLFEKSVDCYTQLIELDSANAYFRVRKADLLYRVEKFEEALSEYLKTDSTYNSNYMIRSIAMCYDKLNRAELAMGCYAEAWEINAKDAYSALSLVKIHIKKGEYIPAWQNSEAFIQMDSTNLQMRVLNAFILYNMEEYDEAANRFLKCRAQGDSSVLVNRTIGNIYYIQEKDSLALPYLSQAYLQDTTNLNVLYSLANVNYRLKLYSGALSCYKKLSDRITATDNLHFLVLKGQGMAFEGEEKYVEALDAYNAAARKTPYAVDKMDVYYRIANMCENGTKDSNSAIFYYEQYRVSLSNYQIALKDEKEIQEIEEKIEALLKHIQQLKNERDRREENPIKEVIRVYPTNNNNH